MMKWNHKIFRVLVMLVVLAFLVMSSAVFALEIKPLKKDKMSPKSQSIIFGRLRLISDIAKFNPIGSNCKIVLYDSEEQKKLRDLEIIIKNSHRIKTPKDTKGYDIPFYAEAQTGDYIFAYANYTFNETNFSDLSVSWDGYFYGLPGNISKLCSISEGSLIYLGVMEIRFTDVYLTQTNEPRVSTEISISMDDFDNDLANFQKLHPKLYEQFKDNVVKADWVDLKF